MGAQADRLHGKRHACAFLPTEEDNMKTCIHALAAVSGDARDQRETDAEMRYGK
ncbi:hypothetical protein AZ20_0419 [Bordetella bronchiseptica E014]|nr:hypothetical protein L576_0460 [Bordetella bronchiseptica OSU054]KAK70175.1 hypothetical protein L507_0443 [Bordetella bronchiseptica CA90 BB02]KCV51979.1 hypothetical protein L492_0462 [Bordetella bronchiseptica 7E71]KDB76875.1 hypothetical protein L494_0446 [Bordetella bronchiseptica CA90 BB1334]KDC17616.1 hypothetical protein AZ20_0419 [Bordetella bronchiseptica E014]KDC22239.1 hypothetical protein L542_0450 [Bordetella bronchiseptica F-1]KDC24507.1 hypothetical protein L505_0483 [Borde